MIRNIGKVEKTKEGMIIKVKVERELIKRISKLVYVLKLWGRIPKNTERLLLGEVNVEYYGFSEKWYVLFVKKGSMWNVYLSDYKPENIVELSEFSGTKVNFEVNATFYGLSYNEWYEILKNIIKL